MKAKGHKCLGATIAVRVKCECGFVAEWMGPDARKNAYREWRAHVEAHAAAETHA